jgi:hypothetical protein
MHEGRLSDGTSQSGKEVLAQELLPLLRVQQAIEVSWESFSREKLLIVKVVLWRMQSPIK